MRCRLRPKGWRRRQLGMWMIGHFHRPLIRQRYQRRHHPRRLLRCRHPRPPPRMPRQVQQLGMPLQRRSNGFDHGVVLSVESLKRVMVSVRLADHGKTTSDGAGAASAVGGKAQVPITCRRRGPRAGLLRHRNVRRESARNGDWYALTRIGGAIRRNLEDSWNVRPTDCQQERPNV
jgi:hypothetical protein